jgi:hypothetical protein
LSFTDASGVGSGSVDYVSAAAENVRNENEEVGGETDLVASANLEHNGLADGCRRAIRAGLASLFLAELGPRLPLRDGMVDERLLEHTLCLARDLSIAGRDN